MVEQCAEREEGSPVANNFENWASSWGSVFTYHLDALLFHLPNICTWMLGMLAFMADVAAPLQKLCVV